MAASFQVQVAFGSAAKGEMMAGSGKKWLIGCGLGCGIPLLVAIVLAVGGSIVTMKPFNRAIDAQKQLIAAHGERADFTPDAAGLRPERLEAFLGVRRALEPMCTELSEMGRRMRRVEALEKDGDDPSKAEAFQAVGDVMGAAFGLAGNIGRFAEARNQALLAQGMGLGEYVWIYTLAYHSWLGYPARTGLGNDTEEHLRSEDQQLIRQLMQRYSGALAAAGRTAEAAAWAAESDRLERSEGTGVPWAGGEFPAALAADLEPYRQPLEDLYCPDAATFEFTQMKKKGLSVRAE